MTPFRAMEGVDRTAEAIHHFSDTAERFSDVVSQLPESSRWQMQLLLYDLEETDMTKSFLESLARVSESSSKLAETSQDLPKQIRQELGKFVEDVDAKQVNLQKTLTQAEKTTQAVSDAMVQLNKSAEALSATAKDVTAAAGAWETAAKATNEAAAEVGKMKPAEGESSFDIKAYQATAEQVSQAANDIKALLAAMEDFSENRSYSSIADGLMLRIGGLIALVFVLAVAYRLISSRIGRSERSRAA
jgi:methyl-accepting chemotaxis protein